MFPQHILTMANDNRRTVTVYGATGAQGGAVARSLLKNNAFKVRAITRKPDSEAAKALGALGAEIVQGDGWSKEQMVAAFSGSWAAFVNTNSDDPVRERCEASQFDLAV